MSNRLGMRVVATLSLVLNASCGDSPTPPQDNPLPTIAGLDPATAIIGRGPLELTVTGTGFVASSVVRVGFDARPTTFVSATQLTATLPSADFMQLGTLAVRVLNPAPGGGNSDSVSFSVTNPAPSINSLGVTQLVAGQGSYVLRVNGAGFVSTSEVRLNGEARATTLVNGGALDAALTDADLATVRTISISVANPGVAASAALDIPVINSVPVLALLPVRGASAGSGGFTMWVHGTGFNAASVVRWNGVDQPTQFVSSTRLAATVGSADVAAAGSVAITVHNPGTGGGTTGSATLTVRAVGAPTATTSTIAVRAQHLVYDVTRSRIYASVAALSPSRPNTVIAIDPATGTIVDSSAIGSNPAVLALSQDDQYLYIGLDGDGLVKRVHLPSFDSPIQWGLGTMVGVANIAADMAVLPGTPTAVAITARNPNVTGRVGPRIYDGTVQRPTTGTGSQIEFTSAPEKLYGYEDGTTAATFFSLDVSTSGVSQVSTTPGLIGEFADILGGPGRIYASDGAIIDAERRVRIAKISVGFEAMSFAIDADLGRAYYLTETNGIRVFDLNTLQLLGTIPGTAPVFTRLIRWGTDGVAFLDNSNIRIMRAAIIGP